MLTLLLLMAIVAAAAALGLLVFRRPAADSARTPSISDEK